MDDIVAQVKQAIKIEDVIAGDGFKLPTRGRYRKAAHSNGLVVDTRNQTYHWNGTGEYGDVIAWVMARRKVDFKEAVSWLASRAGLPEPNWGHMDQAARLAARAREDALTVAAQVFAGWFWRSAEAQEYARGRGWTLEERSTDDEDPDAENKKGLVDAVSTKGRDTSALTYSKIVENQKTPDAATAAGGQAKLPVDGATKGQRDRWAGTCAKAMLGFSGSGTDAEREEMRAAFVRTGIDLECKEAVAILGYKGNVTQWALAHQVNDLNDDWLMNGWIPGMLGNSRIVYPHRENGRVVYLSARGIHGKMHFNLPVPLIGKRRPYYNHEYAPGEDRLVVVEGQADAVSLAQWDIPAMALAGVSLDVDLALELNDRHKAVYIALDMDVAGISQSWQVADRFGPMARLFSARDPMGVTFPTSENMSDLQKQQVAKANSMTQALARVYSFPIREAEAKFPANVDKKIKDLNDLLQAMELNKVDAALQREYAAEMLKKAPTFAEYTAAWAGARQGAERDQAVRDALAVIARLEDMDMTQYRSKLAKLLGVGVRELTNMIKTHNEKAKEAAAVGEPELTWGGFYHGWLIDYIFDPESGYARLAWRDPNGKVDSGQNVTIEGKRYEPFPPTEGIRKGTVLMPSKVGEKKTLKELATYIELYLKMAFIMPSDNTGKLISIYVLLTWLYDCFDAVSYLAFMGDTGSGKSQLMFRTGMICYRPIISSGASSVSSLFRMVDRYKGSVIIDEADLEKSDTTQDMVKFYNTGAMKGGAITKSVDVVLPDGRHDYEERAFQTYCPKLMTLKRNFQDDAVTSRSLVIKLQPREMVELVRKNISLNVDDTIREKAKALRNLLLRFRLEAWQPTIKVDQNFYDLSISARLNQIAGGLLAIARDDIEQQDMIRESLRGYYRESQVTKSMTITARVIEAMWSMYKFPDMRQAYLTQEADGSEALKIGDICKVANDIIDRMNSDDSAEEEEKKFKAKGIKPHSVGRIIRDDLQLKVSQRKRDGFFVYWDDARMEGVALRYGLELDQIGPMETPLEKEGKKNQAQINTNKQEKLI